ncbi:MAG: hypothetical protein ABW292_17215 [Vicinamibacterales bacterium]
MDSFLFALALAVGLTPQLLPAIISVNLAKGELARMDPRAATADWLTEIPDKDFD